MRENYDTWISGGLNPRLVYFPEYILELNPDFVVTSFEGINAGFYSIQGLNPKLIRQMKSPIVCVLHVCSCYAHPHAHAPL